MKDSPDESHLTQDTDDELWDNPEFVEDTDEDKQESEGTQEATEEAEDEATESEETEEQLEEESESQEPDEAEENPEQPEESDDDIKKRNAEMAQRRIAERERRLAEEQALKQAQDEYVAGAENDAQAVLRKMEIKEYSDTVRTNENRLVTEYERVKADPELQAFNRDSKDYNPELADMFESYFERGFVVNDRFGNIVAVNGSLYQEAKKWAGVLGKQKTLAQAEGQKAAKRNLSKADNSGASNHKPPAKSDPIAELWDSDD